MKRKTHGSPQAEHILQLRQWRGVRGRSTPISSVIKQFTSTHQRIERQLSAAVSAWNECAPLDLIDQVSFQGMQRGDLVLAVANNAIRFTLDSALRAGLQRKLTQKCPAIRRVSVVVNEIPFLEENN